MTDNVKEAMRKEAFDKGEQNMGLVRAFALLGSHVAVCDRMLDGMMLEKSENFSDALELMEQNDSLEREVKRLDKHIEEQDKTIAEMKSVIQFAIDAGFNFDALKKQKRGKSADSKA